MKSIETIATVTKNGKITPQLPLDIVEGEHQMVTPDGKVVKIIQQFQSSSEGHSLYIYSSPK
ncbi:hypothetical protein [Nostoc sp.]|uniref:hypothetical protein n=1 Tax=Nostoc sp. TaxID=1180 RepID=UPI002FFC3F19